MYAEPLVIAFGLALLGVAWHLRERLRRGVGYRPNRPRARRYPTVTTIHPIKGLDAGAKENFRAALRMSYARPVETLFVFDDPSEPAVPLAEAAIVEHQLAGRPGTARIVYCGNPPPGRTGKLNAMIAGLEEATGELIAFVDSDVRPQRHALTALVDALLGTPNAGSAFAPVAVTSRPRTLGDAAYAMLLNGLYGPNAAETARRNDGELGFIMGQFMIFRRSAIAAIGGLESARGQLVDDMYIGARIEAAGYKNAVADVRVPIVQEGLGFSEFLSVYRRWITFSRSGLPGRGFKVRSWVQGAVFWLGLLVGIGALFAGAWVAAFANLLAPVVTTWVLKDFHEEIGGAPLGARYGWVASLVLLYAPDVLFRVLRGRSVEWRGRVYELGSDARLSSGDALASDETICDAGNVVPMAVSGSPQAPCGPACVCRPAAGAV